VDATTEGGISTIKFENIGKFPQQRSGDTSELRTYDDAETDTDTGDNSIQGTLDIENPAFMDVVSEKDRGSTVVE
jgi:hypothetical protein